MLPNRYLQFSNLSTPFYGSSSSFVESCWPSGSPGNGSTDHRIYIGMKVLLTVALTFLFPLASLAGTPGEFRGTVVNGPEKSGQWVYVEGHNHAIRRVDVRGAKIHYDSEVPPSERLTPVPKSLPLGTQIRVTAEQDDAGEWRATDVEILKGSTQGEKKATIPTTSQS